MKLAPERYIITILGDSYSIMSDEEPEMVMKLAHDVESAMRTMAAKLETNDLQKIAVLVALQFAHLLRDAKSTLHIREQKELKIIDYMNQQLSSLIVS